MTELKFAIAQINPLVGDITGNTRQIIEYAIRARDAMRADCIVFSELAVTGYPPEDLLLRPSLEGRMNNALQRMLAEVHGIYLIVGYPRVSKAGLLNAAGVIYNGEIIAEYAKQALPNYRVFDDKRYFISGDSATIVDIKGCRIGLSICEDIWVKEPTEQARAAGARCLININASPFYVGKQQVREAIVMQRAAEGAMPVLYVHMVGGQDELVYDGGSFAADSEAVRMRAPNFEEGLFSVSLEYDEQCCRWAPDSVAPLLEDMPSIYHALVLGMRDYVHKNGFNGVVLGLSGGIDSALTLAVAVDALGAERVSAVMMPFRYTAQMSQDDAAEQARTLGIHYRVIPIESMYTAFMQGLAAEFEGKPADKTEENLQARCRGVILMAISNKMGSLVLTTGNKSELAVGYSTLYGDMAGGFDVLKDVPKMRVYALASYRNSLSPIIPQRVIDRPPSAELAPGQKDQDSLPPYEILDQILELYVEQDCSAQTIIDKGFDDATVRRVLRMVDLNEYKRRQAPIGVRITQRGFGRDRRYPITSGWEIGA